jgi:hypothetical protein
MKKFSLLVDLCVPRSIPPLELFDKHKEKEIFIFGDFNAKHQDWKCENNNVSGSKENWGIERLVEGTSDHYPILFFITFPCY